MNDSPVVQLRAATLPFPLGLFAVHCWFVVVEPDGGCQRWEVWQTPNAGGRSIGHLHCDLKPPEAGVGGGPSRIVAEWRGDPALRIRNVLQSAERYPFCTRYRAWPGPNSNTFVAWVLRTAGIEHRLGRQAWGRTFPTG